MTNLNGDSIYRLSVAHLKGIAVPRPRHQPAAANMSRATIDAASFAHLRPGALPSLPNLRPAADADRRSSPVSEPATPYAFAQATIRAVAKARDETPNDALIEMPPQQATGCPSPDAFAAAVIQAVAKAGTSARILRPSSICK